MLVILQSRVQYDQFFTRFSYFVDLFTITAKYINHKNIGLVVRSIHSITRLSLRGKSIYFLLIHHLSRERINKQAKKI